MAFFTSSNQRFQWDQPTGTVGLAAAALCLVPTLGFLLAWHMQVDLAAFSRYAILPALAALGLAEMFLATKSPLLFNRFSSGLAGGIAATAIFDAVRLPLAYLFKGAPDYVPLIGQHMLHETIGIAPSMEALVVGYGYHYLLVGALLGAAYSLLIGKGRWQWALAAGAVLGAAFVATPQFQLLAVASGFNLLTAAVLVAGAFALGGLLLGGVVQRLGRTTANVLQVVFLRHEPVETPARR